MASSCRQRGLTKAHEPRPPPAEDGTGGCSADQDGDERDANDHRRERHDGDDAGGRRGDDASPEADEGRRHQRDDGGAEASHNALDHADRPERHVDGAEGTEQDERRQDEQTAGRQGAAHAVQPVADVRRELLSLRTGERHAEVQTAQECGLVDPAPPFDELVVHERDLAGRPAERDAAEAKPEPERLSLGG